MKKSATINTGIPISTSLSSAFEKPEESKISYNKKRLITIALLAIAIAIGISLVAKFLIYLIDLITNISFYGNFSFDGATPAGNQLGFWVILIPAAGGLIVGLMALYGSVAIRGHGIPEAMEQILTNQSKIKPSIMVLKPLSAAISIGTGGPFGAEGPIIATGGALGSTIGQILKITHNERKILLAAGATAGMSAIFGTPIAAIFLAIELLLFEFSPRSFIPVALACITGAAGHHFLFEPGYVFPITTIISLPTNSALFAYSLMGILIGLISVGVTKIVYFVEDFFEKLPIHWAWWPAIGGLFVGIVGYFSPRTLGVGYQNIAEILNGHLTFQILLSLCFLKFISWAISLGSGTSGGTLAPLLTIGGAAGAILGHGIQYFYPDAGISIILAALVGMSAMFAGASRAYITSILFALESTGQTNALLPLLASCTAAYFVSFFFMENTIMTEKIARRGIKTPDSYEPDVLEKISAGAAIQENGLIIREDNTISEVRSWLNSDHSSNSNYFIIAANDGTYTGILSASNLLSEHHDTSLPVGKLIKRKRAFVTVSDNLRTAVELMAQENIDVVPVVSAETKQVTGLISYKDIIAMYKHNIEDHEKKQPNISLKRHSLRMLVRGQQIVTAIKLKGKDVSD